MSKDQLIEKLETELKKKGINFTPVDELGKNVVFWNDAYTKKICHEQFHRHSGVCSYKINVGEHEFKMIPMDDSMFYLSWVKTVVEYSFDAKTKK